LSLAVHRLLFAALLAAAALPPAFAQADRIYSGGTIITMDPEQPRAEALLVRDGRIVALGARAKLEGMTEADAEHVDLQGFALLPGLIDAHGHLGMVVALQRFVNVASPPVGGVANIDELVAALEDKVAATPAGEWVLGFGYDDALLAEARHPNRDDLDSASREHPIFLLHVSGHLGTCSSKCLEVLGINADSPDPEGGVIRRRESSSEPNGVLEEGAVLGLLTRVMQANDESERLAWLEGAQDYFASRGITTVQDGATSPDDLAFFQRAAEMGRLKLDVAAFPLVLLYTGPVEGFPFSRDYVNGFRVGGAKLLLDGSPQGKTAWLTEPYHEPPEGRDADYRGYGLMRDQDLIDALHAYFREGVPVLAHVNGDAAGDQLISAVEQVRATLGDADRRTVVIHGQTLRADQVARLGENSLMPSYFVAHTFYWGDWHRDSVLGEQRASRISPLATTLELGVPFTIHNDSPVVPPDMMLLLSSAVNRVTRSGQVLGAAERISVEEALKAITINAAYQYFEEDNKGSLEAGKLADLVILSHDPTEVDPMFLKDIKVIETIKAGETIYRAEM